eukprot:scaffold7695_cov109-Cyclotella_meneghiniana.AAC.1
MMKLVLCRRRRKSGKLDKLVRDGSCARNETTVALVLEDMMSDLFHLGNLNRLVMGMDGLRCDLACGTLGIKAGDT